MYSQDVRMAEKNGELKVKYMRKILCYIYENMADFEIVLMLHCLRDIGKLFCTSIFGTCRSFENTSFYNIMQ